MSKFNIQIYYAVSRDIPGENISWLQKFSEGGLISELLRINTAPREGSAFSSECFPPFQTLVCILIRQIRYSLKVKTAISIKLSRAVTQDCGRIKFNNASRKKNQRLQYEQVAPKASTSRIKCFVTKFKLKAYFSTTY